MSRACGGASRWVLCACLAASAHELPPVSRELATPQPERPRKGDGEQCGLWGISATEFHAGECAEGFLCPPLDRRDIPHPQTCQPVLGKGQEDNGQACRVVVELILLVGPNLYAGSETGATVSFNIGGEWTQERTLFQSVEDPDEHARQGEVLTAAYWLMDWPQQIRLTAGGDDAFGYKRITLVLPDGYRMSVIREPTYEDLSYPTSEDSPGYRHWIDGNELAPRTQMFDVGQDVDKKCFEAKVHPTPAPTTVTTIITTASSATSTSHRGDDEPEFSCQEGYARWETGWSDEKKAWCCRTWNVGCTFDCGEELDRSASWSQAKKNYCCKEEDVGCEFDCEAGYSNWEEGWSDEKKQFCCTLETVGCKYDCWADSDQMVDWPRDKREWCCDRENRGCVQDAAGASRRELHLLRDGQAGPRGPRRQEGAVPPRRLPGVVTNVAGCLLVVLVVGSCVDIARRRQRALAGYRQSVTAGTSDAERNAA